MDLADAGQGRDNGRDATGLLADHQKLLQQDGDEVGSSPLQALRLAMALPGSAQSVSGSSSEAAAEGREPDSARLRAAYQAMLQRMEQRHQQERARLQHVRCTS
jgi:phage portal protein BeeE